MRTIPHVHGAARDVLETTAEVVNRELASITDNPIVAGTPEAPRVIRRRMRWARRSASRWIARHRRRGGRRDGRAADRPLVNPLVSGLPAFLAEAAARVPAS